MAKELAVIELRLEGAEGVREMLEHIEDLKKSAEGRIEIRTATESAHRKILELKADMDALRKTMENSEKGSGSYKNAAEGLKETRQEARAAQTEYRILNKAKQEAAKIDREIAKAEQQAAKEAEKMAKEEAKAAAELERLAAQAPKVKTLGENFKTWSSRIAHAGSAMQSFGNALTQLTSPFKQLTSGLVMGAGYKMLNKFTEGLSNGFNRYDTMKKYPKIMAAFGYSNEEAQKSIDALDKSVRGLPTGLDEMVDLAQRFTATTGDIDKGTKLAIAANNAFLASMSTDTQKYQGMMQLQDVLGGKDMNAREWNSLVSSMTPAIVKMGESLGYTNKNMDEWIQKVRDGKVDNQKFVDTLIKIGNEGGVLQAMANESKDTWQAFFANVGNAASRMTAGVITSMDAIVKTLGLKDKDGNAIESVNRLLSDRLIPTIDDMTASAKAWIEAHPQEITDFFKQLAGINWRSLVTGLLQGLKVQAEMFSLFANIANKVGGGSLAWVTKWGVILNLVGKGFTIFGGLLKGTRHPLGALLALLTTKLGGKGLFGGLIEKIFGKKLPTKEIAEAPKAIDSLRGVVKSLSGLMKVAGGIGIATLTGWGVTKAVKSIIHDLKDISVEMEGVNWRYAAEAMGGFAGFCTAFGLVGIALNEAKVSWKALKGVAIAGAFTTFIAFVTSADFQLLATGAKAFNSMTKNIKSAFDNLDQIGEIPDKASNVKDFAQGLVEIYSAFGGNKKDEGFNAIKPKKVDNFNKIASGMNSTIENLGKIGASLKGLTKKGLPTEEEVTAISDSLKPVLEALGNMVYNAPKVLKNNESGNLAQYMSDSFKGLNDAIGILLGKKGLIARLPELAKGIGRLQGLKVLETLGEDGGQFDQLGAALKKMANSLTLGGFNTDQLNLDIGNILSAVGNVQAILKKLKALGKEKIDAKGTGNIQKVIENIKKAFDTAKATELSGQIMIFVTAVKAAIQTIKDLNEEIEIDITFKLSQGFYDSKKKVIKEIKDAKKDIKSQNGGISFSIGVRVFFRVATNFASAMARITRERQALWRQTGNGNGWITGHVSTGGQISRNGVLYRSGGGSIFRPRGTDKIPAMLTQGEYVHKKQAVDYFGVDFMRKVNNMDVRGAMQSLLTKAGNNNSFNRQSIINNTVNNNQRVTQNISTNNPNFTRVQMGRFAGAL